MIIRACFVSDQRCIFDDFSCFFLVLCVLQVAAFPLGLCLNALFRALFFRHSSGKIITSSHPPCEEKRLFFNAGLGKALPFSPHKSRASSTLKKDTIYNTLQLLYFQEKSSVSCKRPSLIVQNLRRKKSQIYVFISDRRRF